MACCLQVLYPLLLLLIVVYVVVPTVVKFTAKLSRNFSVVELESDLIPPEAAGYFGRVSGSTGTLGFTSGGYFHLSDMSAGSESSLALWLNAKTAEAAISVAMTFRPLGRSELMQRVQFTQFLTRSDDGASIVTSNSPRLNAFRPAGTRNTIFAPGIDSPAVLYRLHAAHAAALGHEGTMAVLPEPGREREWLEQLIAEEIETQIAAGHFQPAGGGDYVPTWTGAFLMTYDQLPPMKQMRRSQEEARAKPFADAARVTL